MSRFVALPCFLVLFVPSSNALTINTDMVHSLDSSSKSLFLRAEPQKVHKSTLGFGSLAVQATLSDEQIQDLDANMFVNLSKDMQGHANATTAFRSRPNGTQRPRNIFINLGANWANTMRLYEDLMPDKAEQPWEIYSFEASPFIQPYLEQFIKFLNGQGPKPPVTVPPSGSSLHLNEFAPRYGCRKASVDPWNELGMQVMRNCMFSVFAKPLGELKADPALKDPDLIKARLAEASSPLPLNAKSRFVAVPAAAGAEDGKLTLGMMTPEQMIRGGAISHEIHGAPVQTVPMVDVATWITNNFQETDNVVVKMDIEGAEFPILNALLANGNICKLDILALECHAESGPCKYILQQLKKNTCVKLLLEDTLGYIANSSPWDHYSSPDKYYAIDPRR